MATRNIYTDSGVVTGDDGAARASSVVMRDANGDTIARRTNQTRLITAGVTAGVTAKTTGYTATADDFAIDVDATGGAVTITLPAVASSAGVMLHIRRVQSGGSNVTIQAAGAELINGANTVTLSSQYASRLIRCTGTDWAVIASV